MAKPKNPFYEHSLRAGDWQDGFEAACRAIVHELRQRNRWGAGAVPDAELADQIETWEFGPVEPAMGDRR